MAKLEPTGPAFAMASQDRSVDIDPTRTIPATAPTMEHTDTSLSRDPLSAVDAEVSVKKVLQDLYSEYYQRGINILKPEIVLSTEFSPIQVLPTSGYESAKWEGLRIESGGKEIPVSQVLRLIELHRTVQDVVNISAVDIINSSASADLSLGQFDAESVINGLKASYHPTVLKDNLEDSIQSFIDYMANDSSADQTVSDLARGGILSPNTAHYKAFKVLVENAILEQIQYGICEYFSKVVDLRRQIFNLIDFRAEGTTAVIQNGSAILSDNILAYLEDTTSKAYFTNLNAGFRQINDSNLFSRPDDPTPGNVDVDTRSASSNSEFSSFGALTYLSDLLNPSDIAIYGLGTKTLSRAESNNIILYSLFHKAIMNSYIPNVSVPDRDEDGFSRSTMHDYLGYGYQRQDRIESSSTSITDNVLGNFYLNSNQLESFKQQLDTFFKLGTSSFSLGPITRADIDSKGNNGNAEQIKLYYYGSRHQNEAPMSLFVNNGFFRGFFQPVEWWEDPVNIGLTRTAYDMNTANGREANTRDALIVKNSYNERSKLRSLAELYALSLIDVVTDINTIAEPGSEFSNSISTRVTSPNGAPGQDEASNTYMYKVLGDFGAKALKNANNGAAGTSFKDNAYTRYQGESIDLDPRSDFGLLGEILLGSYEILSSDAASDAASSSLGMLPSETTMHNTAPRTLPGHLGIPTEAFVKRNYDSLNDYIGKLTEFTNTVTKDIMNVAGIGTSSSESGAAAHEGIGTSKPNIGSPGDRGRSMFRALAEALESDFLSMESQITVPSAPPYSEGDSSYGQGAYGDDNNVGLLNLDLGPDNASSNKTIALPLTLIYAIMAGEDETNDKVLEDFFGAYYYQTIMKDRSQSNCSGVVQKWWTRMAFDCVNSMARRFATKTGLPLLGKLRSENTPNVSMSRDTYEDLSNDRYVDFWQDLAASTNNHGESGGPFEPYYVGQITQYLLRQSHQLEQSNDAMAGGFKGAFIRIASLADTGKETTIFGPSSTKSLFIESRDLQTWDNAAASYPQNLADSMNDTWCDIFMPNGLHDQTHAIGTSGPNSGHFMDVIHKPMTSLKERVAEYAPDYLFGRFAGEGSDYSGPGPGSTITQYTYINEASVTIPDAFDHTAGTSDVDKIYSAASCLNPAEDIAPTTGPYRTTEIQRDFATFGVVCSVLAKCINVGFTINYHAFGANVDRYQLQAVVDAFKGTAKRSATELFSSSNDAKLCTAGDALLLEKLEEAVSYKLYDESYDNARNAMKEALAPLYDRENTVKVCLGAIYQHIANLNQAKNLISSVTNTATLSQNVRLGLNYIDQVSGPEQAVDTSQPINNVKAELLRYITPASTAAMYKNAINLGTSSSSRPMFSPIDSFSEEQVHLMALALTGMKAVGVSKHEKMGKKSIISVGLPPNLIESLRLDALTYGSTAETTANNNISFENSPYICIHLFKQDSMGGTLKYCPKPFLFNTSIIDIENFNSTLVEEADHVINAADISSYNELLENFCLYRVDYQTGDLLKVKDNANMKNDSNDLKYMNDADASTYVADGYGSARSVALKEMRQNHILDHYLKMYMRLTTGLDVGEFVFPLEKENGVNSNGGIDSEKVDEFGLFRENLFIKYPSINVDKDLRGEFARLENSCKRSSYFSARKKARSVMSTKSFARVFSMLINESDFVVYPNPTTVRSTEGMTPDATVPTSERLLVESIEELYDHGTYFHLGAGQQIEGINPSAKQTLLFNAFVGSETGSLVSDSMARLLEDSSSRTKSLLRHIEDVESENVADVYQLFAVVSLVRKE